MHAHMYGYEMLLISKHNIIPETFRSKNRKSPYWMQFSKIEILSQRLELCYVKI